MHDAPLITTLAVSFSAALFFGIIARRLHVSPIAGFLLAGILTSPNTPGFAGDAALAGQLSEIGVILLMFGVGLEFHLKDLLAVRQIALPGALLQSAAATGIAMVVAHLTGLSWQSGLVLGIAVSVASTVVLMRVLMDNECLDTPSGHIAVGWLIVEDLITVMVLVLLPALAGDRQGGGTSVLMATGIAVAKLAVLGVIVALAGPKVVPWLLLRVARLRSRELFTLSVLVMSISVAAAAYYAFGASLALGAFLAGMLVSQSDFSHQAASEILPLRDAFAVLFFVSVGMLFDFHVVLDSPGLLLGMLFVVLVVKALVGFAIVIGLRHSLRSALMVAGGLAQIGEFSFILSQLAKTLGLMPGDGEAVLVAVAVVSISLNPVLFKLILRAEPWLARHPRLGPWLARRSEARGAKFATAPAREADAPALPRAIIVGYGPVGQTVARLLQEFNVEPFIVDMGIDSVGELRNQHRYAIFGDATRPDILEQAGIREARYLILTMPDGQARMGIIATAREINPNIHIVTRARYLRENPTLRNAGASNICFDEVETAAGLTEEVLKHLGVDERRVAETILETRREWHLIADLHSEYKNPAASAED